MGVSVVCEFVLLLWQTVQQQYYNGPEFKYCLLKRSSNSIDWQRLNEVEARTSSYDFHADRRESEYQFAVVSCNLKGQTVPTVIWQYNPGIHQSMSTNCLSKITLDPSVSVCVLDYLSLEYDLTDGLHWSIWKPNNCYFILSSAKTFILW